MTAKIIEWMSAAAEFDVIGGVFVAERESLIESGESPGRGEQCIRPAAATDPDLWPYRDRTVGMLRRYLRLAVEVGRLPSLLGREFFRTRVTSYHTQTFEDTVILVHDVEASLSLLDLIDRTLIGMIVVQEHSHEETAILLHCTRRTVVRRYGEALDRMSEIFLKRKILAHLPGQNSISSPACQEGKNGEFPVSSSG